MVTFWIICILLSNVIEGVDAFTSEQIAEINAMHGQQLSESKDPDVGGVITSGINPLTAVNAIWRALTLEYSFLYTVDYSKTEGQCNAISNAKWQDATASCKIPNIWFLPFAVLMWGPIIGICFYLVLTIWHGFTGN